jgi:hypothetical protein
MLGGVLGDGDADPVQLELSIAPGADHAKPLTSNSLRSRKRCYQRLAECFQR